jgi:hypothetical protein
MLRPLIFISYSHQDEAWKNQLLVHLGVLQPKVDSWDDRQIQAGEDWNQTVRRSRTNSAEIFSGIPISV